MLQVPSKTSYLLLLILVICLIEDVKSRKKAPCNATRHQFYLPAGDMCKRCDKCIPGMELEPLEISDFETSSEHGALGCQRCKRCDVGYFSKTFSYKPCKKCRDCKEKGKTYKEPCTPFSDATCGRKIPIEPIVSSTLTPEIMENSKEKFSTNSPSISDLTTEPPIDNDKTASNFYRYHTTSFVLLVIFVSLIAIFILIVVVLYVKNCRNGGCKGTKNRRISTTALNMETGGAAINDLAVDGAPLVENQPLLVIPETFGNHDIPNEKQLQFVAHLIATNQCYRKVGISLNVPDNDICIIEEENNSIETRAFKVLKKWTQKFADQATVYRLLQVLLCEDRRDVVNGFMVKFQDEFANQYWNVPGLQDSSLE